MAFYDGCSILSGEGVYYVLHFQYPEDCGHLEDVPLDFMKANARAH